MKKNIYLLIRLHVLLHISLTDSLQNRALYPSTFSSQPKESLIVHQKQRNSNSSNNNNNPFEFGNISSDSILNPICAKSYGSSSSSSYLDFGSNQEKHSHSVNHHNHSSWPQELKSDWTQLSMSIPIASQSSSPSTTTDNNNNNNNNTGQDKTTLSPLRLSREFDPSSIQTEETIEPVKKVNTWIPISWGNSMGGPLGEALNNSSTNSPTLGSSPTGVLQKSTFCSLSNSSSVTSPVAENNRNSGDYFHYTT